MKIWGLHSCASVVHISYYVRESIIFLLIVKFTVDDSNLYGIWLNDTVLDSEVRFIAFLNDLLQQKRTSIDQYVFQLWRPHNSFREWMPYKIASWNACNSLVYDLCWNFTGRSWLRTLKEKHSAVLYHCPPSTIFFVITYKSTITSFNMYSVISI